MLNDVVLGPAVWMAVVGGFVVLYLFSCVRVVKEYERAVIFRLGKVLPETKGPGVIVVFWPIDRAVIVSKRVVGAMCRART